ncbi:MAG: hypothetical protein RL648_1294 [Verrucomicrobiota bacterium]
MPAKKEKREAMKAWVAAARLLARYDRGEGHLDQLLDGSGLGVGRWLVMAVFRHRLLIDACLAETCRKRPRAAALNLLRLAMAERIEAGEAEVPQIIHHAVEVGRFLGMSPAELGFLNAVLRRALIPFQLPLDDLLASHPEWLVSRWQTAFGEEATHRLLRWNQSRPRLTINAGEAPAGVEKTPWPDYFWLGSCRLNEFEAALASGELYVQDPFARLPVQLLRPGAGETILDLCAAPGGKTRLLSRAMAGTGRILAVDVEGPRMERLVSNLSGWRLPNVTPVAARVETMQAPLRAEGVVKGSVDAVLLDVPCSNTGVMQKRPDVKFRLSAAAIAAVSEEQARLLAMAAEWVRPGGRLVYSTCSIEPEENTSVVEAFCKRFSDWTLAEQRMSFPWECGHDGGGAFLLTKALAT